MVKYRVCKKILIHLAKEIKVFSFAFFVFIDERNKERGETFIFNNLYRTMNVQALIENKVGKTILA